MSAAKVHQIGSNILPRFYLQKSGVVDRSSNVCWFTYGAVTKEEEEEKEEVVVVAAAAAAWGPKPL